MNRGILTVFGVAVFFAILFGSLTFETVMAAPNSHSSADSGVCHFDNTDTQMWEALWVNSKGQIKAHVNVHGDETFTTDVEAVWCVTNQDGTVVKPPPVCGDGVIEGTEACDDGNNNDNDACLNSCKDAACGDGVIQTGIDQCDDGNTVSGDGCDDSCQIESGPVCGNNVKESGEDCDGIDLGGATCESIPGDGFNLEVNSLGNLPGNVKGSIDGGPDPPSNVLMCNSDCTFDFSWCYDT